MTPIERAYRYLKRKDKFVRALVLCKNLSISFKELQRMNDSEMVSSFGPVEDGKLFRQFQLARYAKYNLYCAGNRRLWIYKGEIICGGSKNLRKGKYPPKRTINPTWI